MQQILDHRYSEALKKRMEKRKQKAQNNYYEAYNAWQAKQNVGKVG